MRKITIALPNDVIAFVDQQAEISGSDRNQVIESALYAIETQAQTLLAAEGYQFYAQEASEFAAISDRVVATALANEW